MDHRIEIDAEGVAIITLARPAQMNALSLEGFVALAGCFEELARDTSVRAVVLTGEGRAFCAGAALDGLASLLGTDAGGGVAADQMQALFDDRVNRLVRAMADLPKPLVCAVNGIAAGGGAGLALAGDVTLAAPEAAFALTFAPKLGILPDAGASWLVARALGRGRALPMMLTGAKVSAAQALDWGMIWQILPEAELLAGARALALTLGQQPAGVLGPLRRAVDLAPSQNLAAHLDFERDSNVALARSADFVEGVSAFLEKRPARFGAK